LEKLPLSSPKPPPVACSMNWAQSDTAPRTDQPMLTITPPEVSNSSQYSTRLPSAKNSIKKEPFPPFLFFASPCILETCSSTGINKGLYFMGRKSKLFFCLPKKQLESAEHHLRGKRKDRPSVTYQARPSTPYQPNSLKD